MALQSSVGAIILNEELPQLDRPTLRVASPRAAFGRVLGLARRPYEVAEGVHPTATVDPSALVDPTARIDAHATIRPGATVEAGATIGAHSYVGEGCHIGAGAVLYPHVVLVQDVELGPGVIVHAGAIIGADGFGYAWDGRQRMKIPQVGGVTIGASAEIGANSCIDRATCGETRVGEGAKIDNLVQVAHNVTIGAHGAIASQTGISGSCRIGDRVVMGGQAAISDHLTLVDDVTLAGRTGVTGDLTESGVYAGFPAQPGMAGIRQLALIAQLPDLVKRLRDLERRISELERR